MNSMPCGSGRATLFLLCLAAGARAETAAGAFVSGASAGSATGPGCAAEHVSGSGGQLDSALLHLALFAMGWAVFHWMAHYGVVYVPPNKLSQSKACALDAASCEMPTSSLAARMQVREASRKSQAQAAELGNTPRLPALFPPRLEAEDLLLWKSSGGSSAAEGDTVTAPRVTTSAWQQQSPGEGSSTSTSVGSAQLVSPAASPEPSSGPPSPPSPSLASLASPSLLTPAQGDAAAGAESRSRPEALSGAQVAEDLLVAGLEAALVDRLGGNLGQLREAQATAGAKTTANVPPWRRTCFHDDGADDGMPLRDYLSRLHWNFGCSTSCYVLALVYIDRIGARNARMKLNHFTCHRLLLTSLVLALKFHDDDYPPYANAFYAKTGGLGVGELNRMEREFCKTLDWNFNVRPDEFDHYEALLYSAVTTNTWH